ncbi:MAG: protein kinase [Thermoguttaceae bacterium]
MADQLAAEIRGRWDEGQTSDAAAVLTEHPELRQHRSIALGLAYDEYRRRRSDGEQLTAEDFVRKFPTLQRSLLLLIQVESLLEHEPALRTARQAIAWPKIGDSFLGFQLMAELGRGTFGRVYRAKETALGNRDVALKLAAGGDAEASLLGRLRHVNIVPVHSVQQDEISGLTAFCMPYLGRATLADVLDEVFVTAAPPRAARCILDAVRRLDGIEESATTEPVDPALQKGTYLDAVLHLAAQLCDALDHAHGHGICHRDLKLTNVLLPSSGRPLLLDFNLATDGALASERIGGTLPYMAPEQLAEILCDTKELAPAVSDPRSDLFSLGVIIYELLSGRLPFRSGSDRASIRQLAEQLQARQLEPPPPLQDLNSQVSGSVASLVGQCLAPDREKRPATARELAAALRQEMRPWRRRKRWINGHRRLAGSLTGVFLVALLLAAGLVAHIPAYSVRQFRQGMKQFEREDWKLATDSFTESLRSAPRNPEALFARARAFCQLGEFRLAFDDFRTAYELSHSPRCIAGKAYCFEKLQQYPAAVALYRDALAGGFSSPGVLNNLGHELLRTARLEEAAKCLRQAIAEKNDLGAAYHNLMITYISQIGRGKPLPQDAVDCAKKAIATGTPSADLYNDAARLLALASVRDPTLSRMALEYLDKALDLGVSPETVGGSPLFESLRQTPAFHETLSRKRSAVSPSHARLVVDPL